MDWVFGKGKKAVPPEPLEEYEALLRSEVTVPLETAKKKKKKKKKPLSEVSNQIDIEVGPPSLRHQEKTSCWGGDETSVSSSRAVNVSPSVKEEESLETIVFEKDAEIAALRKEVRQLRASLRRYSCTAIEEQQSLAEAEEELAEACRILQNTEARDGQLRSAAERRVEELSNSLSQHPEAKLREESWQISQRAQAVESFEKIRSYIPASFGMTQSREALLLLNTTLAEYIYTHRALHLIRMDPLSISKLHSADLFQRYQIHGLGLDETRALWLACVDIEWRDPRKLEWWHMLQAQLRRLTATTTQSKSPFDNLPPRGPFAHDEAKEQDTIYDTNFVSTPLPTEKNHQEEVRPQQRLHKKKLAPRIRSASLPPATMKEPIKKEDWWSQRVRDDASNKALDRARDAAKRMRETQKLSKPDSFFLHDFLKEHSLEKWDLPLGQRFLLTTADIAHMSDRNIQDIANSAGFNKIDVLRFKLALQHLQDSRARYQHL